MEIRLETRLPRVYGRAGRDAAAAKPFHFFRILAVVLSAIVVLEVLAITGIQDLGQERDQAEKAFLLAQAEQLRLQQELEKVRDKSYIEDRARQEYGYARNGEIIYEPVFEEK